MTSPVAASEPATSRLVEETEVLATVFESLLATDADGALVPALAEEWSLADGGRSARLRLRPGLRFSDGTPVTAAAAKASLERAIRLRPDGIPAALAAVKGAEEHRKGETPEVPGIRAAADDRLEFDFVEPLPVFPALLTDMTTAIVRAVPGGDGVETVIGTGPFVVTRRTSDRIVLGRNPHYGKEPARLEAVEFRTGMSASAITSGVRSGEIELARDLSPRDLDAILREPRFRAGLVETPKKGTYFALFNSKSALGGNAALRRALAGVTRSQDFVWAALGRFAVPATGILPPGILGHDAGRRRPLLPREEALALLSGAGLDRADPAHRGGPPDPAGPAPGAHRRALRDLEGARRRDLDRDDRHEVVPRGPVEGGERTSSSRAGWPTTRTRTTSRSTSSTRASGTSGPSSRPRRPTASPTRPGWRAVRRSAKASTGSSRGSSSTSRS